MPLPSRSWNVPWSKKLNMMEAKLKNHISIVLDPPSTEVGGLEEMLPILSSPRPKPIDSGCTGLPPWVRLRESKFLSQRKRQRNGNTYPPCQTAAPPHNLLPPSSHPLKVPFFLGSLFHHQGKSINKFKLTKLNTLGLNVISFTDFSKDKMLKVWKSFRNRAFPFLAIRITNTDRVSFAYLTGMLW